MGPDAARRSFHCASPLTKLALVLAVAAMLPLWPAPVLLAGLAAALAGGFLLGIGRILLARVGALMVPTGIALAIVQGMLVPRGAPARLGALAYYPEGMAHAALVFLRLSLILAAGLVFVMTTRPGDLARALDAAGLPPTVSYLLTAPLSMIEAIAEEIRQVRDSLHLRGLRGRGIRGRLRHLGAMTTPLVRNLITDAPMRAELLDMRGFRALPRRSLLDPPVESRAEVRLRRGLVGLALVQFGMLLL
ncbi:energy-coupling factor transporter transmembrane component T family protein [Paracoccus shandongensis]|uniref:energy-coupling factor transporter transmembrane component T family protein n=1 Tax=Paracoccus shandongensis TaxID=2816048 RepID=UPI001A8E146E|nr:energy-coupling factor transporter transmembrane component T [Paracoccus shandongensis]